MTLLFIIIIITIGHGNDFFLLGYRIFPIIFQEFGHFYLFIYLLIYLFTIISFRCIVFVSIKCCVSYLGRNIFFYKSNTFWTMVK